MPDPADVAQYHMEQMEKLVGVGHRAQPHDHLVAKGECWNCDEPLEEGVKFCDKDCCEDWTKRRASRQR